MNTFIDDIIKEWKSYQFPNCKSEVADFPEI